MNHKLINIKDMDNVNQKFDLNDEKYIDESPLDHSQSIIFLYSS